MNDLIQMRIFVEVVRRGGIGAAARGMEMPKSTVSLRLQQLEERLGARLLNRNTRKLSLTGEGTQYYAKAQEVVRLAEEADMAIVSAGDAPRGILRIASFQLFADTILAPLSAAFMKRHPEVEIRAWVAEAFEDVIGDGIDLAIRAGQLKDSELVARKLGDFEIWLCASPAFVQQTPVLHPRDLETLPVLNYGRSSTTVPWVLRKGEETQEVLPKERLLSNSILMVAEVACAGAGIAALPRILAEERIAQGRLLRLFDDWDTKQLSPAIYALHANRKHMNPALSAFWTFLLERVDHKALNAGLRATD